MLKGGSFLLNDFPFYFLRHERDIQVRQTKHSFFFFHE